MRKLVQFIEKKQVGIKTYRKGQKAVIQGGLADVFESQGIVVILETVKLKAEVKDTSEEKAASDEKKSEPKKDGKQPLKVESEDK